MTCELTRAGPPRYLASSLYLPAGITHVLNCTEDLPNRFEDAVEVRSACLAVDTVSPCVVVWCVVVWCVVSMS